MKLLKSSLVLCFIIICASCKNQEKQTEVATNEAEPQMVTKTEETIKIHPIEHATFVLETENDVIYIDPVGGAKAFEGQKRPTLVLITDIHGDHLNVETLEGLKLENIPVVLPEAVSEKIPSTAVTNRKVLNNGETTEINSIDIEAIPMYNLREEALKFHEKGRGNGYILTINDERIYISGDTEDIPEMRNLTNIDKAFVCMNLPYTMPVESAADAVLDFKPKTVYPYHYRGTEGLSDVDHFKNLVNEKESSINVILLDWY
ncbi:MBL fold metallo-hydrolase [Winogradskyella sp. SYSU M77433]|uniref:MBL fold metallo-hydrolase n=1 Tax=Winogradskyella sp. SYSU M77433 TaxID=3042722 RepID=UPI0024802208|nr:MBL fold metallo-hydrolase [Winogradskyella sp. SYSU M77433]MDH7912526.1 MBL fold metallo-hydrolase [Winogradskyella sp. SYSU M77433]